MKILQINAFCGYGSTGKIAVDIANSMKNGDSCYIAYGYFNTSYKKSYKLLNDNIFNCFKVRLLYNRIVGITGYRNKLKTQRFLEWVDKLQPDIIHLHNIHDDYIHIRELFDYIKSRNIPIVWTFHDCWPFTGRCAYFEYHNCYKWINGCHDCKVKNVYPKTYFLDFSKSEWKSKKNLFNGVKKLTIITPSLWLANYVKQSFLSNNEVKVIHNGIDLNIFKHRSDTDSLISRYNLAGKTIILGVASSWGYRKGLNIFVELAKLIDDDIRIVLIGLSLKQIQSLPSNIIGIQRTESAEELAKWYSLANVYVNPTFEDNYPTTNIEAQACDTPVVAFNTGGCEESIQYGEVTKEKNAKSLYESVLRYINPVQNLDLDKTKLSKETLSSEYFKLYCNILLKK